LQKGRKIIRGPFRESNNNNKSKVMKKNNNTGHNFEICPLCQNPKIEDPESKKPLTQKGKFHVIDVINDLMEHELQFLISYINRKNLFGKKITRLELPNIDRVFLNEQLENDNQFTNLGFTIKFIVCQKLRKKLTTDLNLQQ